jgi:alkaline phosphatase D
MVGAVNLLGSPVNTDSWDGYPAERQRLFNHLSSQNIDNTVVVTGDIHTSWALNLQNGNSPVGVEFVSPSVTSPGAPINLSALITAQNPHIKYVELTKKGFVLVDIDTNRVQGDWYNISTLDQMDPTNSCVKSYITNNGSNSLTLANSPSIGHGPFLQSLADPCSRFAGINSPDLGIIVGVYPNPANQLIKIQSYDLPIESITIYGSNGEIIKTPYSINPWSNGMTITSIDISTLNAGNYFIRINNENQKTCGLKSIPFTKF